MGDYNGIGPEITLKAICSPSITKICTPILIGLTDVYYHYARFLGHKILFREVDKPLARYPQGCQIIPSEPYTVPRIRYGAISKHSGHAAGKAIEKGVDLWRQGLIDGIVTAPVSKEAMNLGGYHFPGQTEMIATLTRGKQFMMVLAAGSFRVGLATIHVPIRNVPLLLTKKIILSKLSVLSTSLKHDFGIRSPRIALLGLNPHAGENGRLGSEEMRIIHPALREAQRKGINAEGTFPADGFFGTGQHTQFDAILAMYHDQGLIPLKMQGFNLGVNITVGLPIVRTSPDHGTAFAIAGKGCANPSSMIEAIKLAVRIIYNRKKTSL